MPAHRSQATAGLDRAEADDSKGLFARPIRRPPDTLLLELDLHAVRTPSGNIKREVPGGSVSLAMRSTGPSEHRRLTRARCRAACSERGPARAQLGEPRPSGRTMQAPALR